MTASMPPRSSGVRVSPIRSDRDLEKALREIDALMDAARPGSEEEDRLEILSTLVDVLLSLRGEARREQRFHDADRLREILAQVGVEVEDTPTGTGWSLAHR